MSVNTLLTPEDEITVAEAMRLCGYLNHQSVQYHIKRGRLASRKIGSIVVLDRREVLELSKRLAAYAGVARPHCRRRP